MLLPKQVTFKENPIICYWFLFQMARVRFEDSMLATANWPIRYTFTVGYTSKQEAISYFALFDEKIKIFEGLYFVIYSVIFSFYKSFVAPPVPGVIIYG